MTISTDQTPEQPRQLNPELAGAEAILMWLLDTHGELSNYVPSSEDDDLGGVPFVRAVVRRHGAVVWRGESVGVGPEPSQAGTRDAVRAFCVGVAQRHIVLRCLLPEAITDPRWSYLVAHASTRPIPRPTLNANDTQAPLPFQDQDGWPWPALLPTPAQGDEVAS